MDRLIVNSPVGRPLLGVELTAGPLPDSLRPLAGADGGVIIRRALPVLEQRLANAGARLPAPCALIAINGQPIRSIQDVRYEVARSRAGALTSLVVVHEDGGAAQRSEILFRLPAEPLAETGYFR